jgi:glutathione synthase/RimK-type ligase-like ATP-grasp enzyme
MTTDPRPIALVTARAARADDHDLPPLLAALQARHAAVEVVDWDDASADWARFQLALLRSPWDYTSRLPEFLGWVERAGRATRLLNPPGVVRWNVDKHYLGELARQGVDVVPSHYVEPGDDAAAGLEDYLAAQPEEELVVKPTVGAGSRDAQRHDRGQRAAALAHVRRLQSRGATALLQPYLGRVDEQGETALLYFDGRFSHAIRKGPLLRRGEESTRALFAPEHITPRTPDVAELALAERVLAAIPFGALLYARVDLIRAADGSPCLLELELTEPSVFLAQAAGAAEAFATAILQRL